MEESGQPVFLEVFSGSGRLALAWRRVGQGRLGAFELDIMHDPGLDLLQRRVQQRVRGWVRSGLVAALWLGTPCQSMTLARNRPNGPPPLRNSSYPEGLPGLSPCDALKVLQGNRLCAFSFSLFELALGLGIPVGLENPSSSWLWKQPVAQRVSKRAGVQRLMLDFCAFGTPWRKRTAILYANADLSGLRP